MFGITEFVKKIRDGHRLRVEQFGIVVRAVLIAERFALNNYSIVVRLSKREHIVVSETYGSADLKRDRYSSSFAENAQ